MQTNRIPLLLCSTLLLLLTSLRSSQAQSYASLNSAPGNGVYRLENNQLRFTFFEPYQYNQNLEYDIRDANGNLILEVNPSTSVASNFLVPHARGKNKVSLDVSSLPLAPGAYYMLRVYAGKKDIHYLTFLKP